LVRPVLDASSPGHDVCPTSSIHWFKKECSVPLFGKPKPILVHIEAKLAWEVSRDPETQTWIGICRPLNLNAIGETWAEFHECANDAIALLLTTLLREGQLEIFLRRHGWVPSIVPPPTANVRWDVPFDVQQLGQVRQLVPA